MSTLFDTVKGIGSDGHIDDDNLMNRSDDEAGRNITAHLRWCDYCADRRNYLAQHATGTKQEEYALEST